MDEDQLYTIDEWNQMFNKRGSNLSLGSDADYTFSADELSSVFDTPQKTVNPNATSYNQSSGSDSVGGGFNWGGAAMGIGAAIPSTPMQIGGNTAKNGLWDAADPTWYLANGRSSKAGDTVSNIGVNVTKAGLASGNPWVALAGAVIKIGGSITNAWGGEKQHTDNINLIKGATDQMRTLGSQISQAGSNSEILGMSGSLSSAYDFSNNNLYEGGWGRKSRRRAARHADNLKNSQASALAYQNQGLATAVNNVDNKNDANIMANFNAGGGMIDTQNPEFPTGLHHVNAGGSHEENPNQGVQYGVDSQNVPNLVEEGETVYDNFVFSNRINIDETTKKRFHINKDMTYAELSKKLEKEVIENPNDPISKNGFKAQIQTLAEQQERQKQEEQAQQAQAAFAALPPEQQAALMQQILGAQSQAQASPEEMAQQQATEQQMPEGSNMFPDGGWLDNFIKENKDKTDLGYDPTLLPQILEWAAKTGVLPKDAGGIVMSPAQAYEQGLFQTLADKYNIAMSPLPPVSGTTPMERLSNIIGTPVRKSYEERLAEGENPIALLTEFENNEIAPKRSAIIKSYADDYAQKHMEDYKKRHPLASDETLADKETSFRAMGESQAIRKWDKMLDNRGLPKGAANHHNTNDLQKFAEFYQELGIDTSKILDILSVKSGKKVYERDSDFPGKQYLDYDKWYNHLNNQLSNRKFNTISLFDNVSNDGDHTFTPEQLNTVMPSNVGNIVAAAAQSAGVPGAETSSDAAGGTGAPSRITQSISIKAPLKADNVQTGGNTVPGSKLTAAEKGAMNARVNAGKIKAPAIAEPKMSVNPIEYKPMNFVTPVAYDRLRRDSPLTNLRYAPIVGNAIGLMQNLVNGPDYSRAEEIKRVSDTVPKYVAPNLLGSYLTFNPADIWAEQNRLDATARATERAIANSSNPSKMAGLLSAGYNNQIAEGELFKKAMEFNDAKRAQIASYNLGIDQANMQSDLQAQLANQAAAQNAAQLRYNGTAAGNSLMDAIDANRNAAINANSSNMLQSMANLGTETQNKDWFEWLEKNDVLRSNWYATDKYK